MLRPATPLAILLFAAFALLLLATISTPIIKDIPLGEHGGFKFGVFGYCTRTRCSPFEIGYDPGYTNSATDDFNIDTKTRTVLSAILIVHPVAALLVLIMFGMAVAAHFHAASHSSRYLLVVFILAIITFLVCLLCFLVDVLIFVPHMAWGSYIVLAATILVFLSFIVSCAMRRTLVSRKARKKRIAENAEMSGENYYNREAQLAATAAASTTVQPTVPSVMSGANNDKLPTFASYESRNDQSSDERIPLTATSPGARSAGNAASDQGQAPTLYSKPSQTSSTRSLPRDQYGNPIGQPQDAYGVRRGPSQERMRGRGGAPGSFRGRGGYDRGGYGPRRGGYGPPGRGGYGPPGQGPYGRGGAVGPRGGYSNGGPRGGRQTPTGYNDPGPNDRRPSPANAYDNYGQPQGPYPPQGAAYGNPQMGEMPSAEQDLPRAESPPPLPMGNQEPYAVGQAIEMDAATGSPAHPPQGFGQFNSQLRDSDADVAGMLALQQGRIAPPYRHDTMMTEASMYSQDDSQYVPPRQGWNQGQNRASPGIPSPLAIPQRIQESPIPAGPPGAHPAASDYYEDVDPRFAQPPSLNRNDENISTDDLHSAPGSRSPAISERSGFTSVSQRPVNPRWNPGPGPGQGYGQMPQRRPVNRGPDLLANNPDFQLPGPGRGVIPRAGAGGAYPAI
ncbi:SUR7/PalI family-domain-containing protein [Microdochium trichocladiopsis]|uniref:SUR7/PalI family-domain-containing protein n=1 Tax=Microdochium trichocladiopsis TaxID=1682393 RepID=A0A9P8YGD4_9PEZI|nr:SUR7/PalI family-domain-containing protein [Microdochium trichocladiopsis]KAH7037494.1 SUR7/PalI family-domain-containing protein [Microdochium trichocladiopsis]